MEEEKVSPCFRRLSARLRTKPKVVRKFNEDQEWSAREAKQKAKKKASKRADDFVVQKQSLKKYYDDEDWSMKSAYHKDDYKVEHVKEKKVQFDSSTSTFQEVLLQTTLFFFKGKKAPLKSKPANASVGKKTKTLKLVSPEKSVLCAYELERLKNIEERQKMFEMLQLGDAKKLFAETLSAPVKRKAGVDDNWLVSVFNFIMHFKQIK